MPRLLVIGYGNRLRGDDGFGPVAAELIAGHDLPGVEVIVCHQLGPELAPELSEADLAIFLDAETADTPGLLKAMLVEPHDLSAATISHALKPGSLVALTRAIYGRAPTAALVTATASKFEHGDEISSEVRTAAENAADVIVRFAAQNRFDADALRMAFSEPA